MPVTQGPTPPHPILPSMNPTDKQTESKEEGEVKNQSLRQMRENPKPSPANADSTSSNMSLRGGERAEHRSFRSGRYSSTPYPPPPLRSTSYILPERTHWLPFYHRHPRITPYRFFVPGLGLHSSPIIGCNLTQSFCPGVLAAYPLLQS